jgi:hypothetical protein
MEVMAGNKVSLSWKSMSIGDCLSPVEQTPGQFRGAVELNKNECQLRIIKY